MGRDQQQQLNTNSTTASNLSSQANQNANQLYGTLAPELTAESVNPQGFSPTTKANLRTANMQTIGGSTAGETGSLARAAARSRNAGGFAPAEDEAVRAGQRQLGQNSLGIENADAALKNQQQQSGIAGLGALNAGQNSQTLGALGLSNDASAKAAQAYQSPWLSILNSAMQGAGTGAGLAAGCWIADELFGKDSIKANMLRYWLNDSFQYKWYGEHISRVYRMFGKRVAEFIHGSELLQLPFRAAFWLAWKDLEATYGR